MYLVVATYFLQTNKRSLDKPEMREIAESLYPSVEVRRDKNKNGYLFYPTWLSRRIFFVGTPIVFVSYPSIQI
jgi:hypothetical protein